jgi:hypothetical protein
MSSVRPLLHAFIASSFLIALPFATARAADPADVASRLKDTFAKQGVELQWKGVSGDDSSMKLSGVTASAAGDETQVAIGDVTLPAYSAEQEGVTVGMSGVSVSGLRLPPPDSSDPLDSVMMYDKSEIGEISVKRGGKQVFDLSNFHVDVKRPRGDDPLEFSAAAESFSADLSETADPESEAAIRALGYQNVQGSFAMAGSWAPKTGEGSLDTYKLTVRNAGAFDISLKMSGCTPEFIRSLHAIREKIAKAPQDQKAAQWAALLDLVQQLSFSGATIRFDDDSLTGKVMDYAAARQGMRRGDLVNQAKVMLPFALAELNDPDLAAEVTRAVSAFLDAPKNLAIEADPPNPVPLKTIAAGAMGAPLQLPRMLGVKVIANQ